MENAKYIAIFDSGIGGFTTLLDALDIFPAENFLFYSDTANVPYGEKPISIVKNLTMKSIENIIKYDVKAIVLACNTATSAAGMEFRKDYAIPIIGMEPAIKPALTVTQSKTKSNRVLLLSTPLTMKGDKLTNLLEVVDNDNRVDCLALPELVIYAEEMDFASQRVVNYIKEKILNLNLEQYGAIVLGCTHFIWYRELLRKLLPHNIGIFDGNEGTLHYLQYILSKSDCLEKKSDSQNVILHFTGDKKPQLGKILKHKMDKNVPEGK